MIRRALARRESAVPSAATTTRTTPGFPGEVGDAAENRGGAAVRTPTPAMLKMQSPQFFMVARSEAEDYPPMASTCCNEKILDQQRRRPRGQM